MKKLLMILMLMSVLAILNGLDPVVTNLTVSQSTDGTKLVTINYDVEYDGPNYISVDVHLVTVIAGGFGNSTSSSGEISARYLTGDYGVHATVGLNKTIIWNVGAELSDYNANNYRIKLVTSEVIPPPGVESFVHIPAGSFTMGDTQGSGDSDELPTHTVHLSAYYVGKYEVTHQEAIDVFNWAYAQGYVTITSSSITNSSGNIQELLDLDDSDCAIDWNGSSLVFGGSSYASDVQCPVLEITWYGSVAYANYLSLQESLTPAYDLSDWSCDFSANGYRLLTEAEWEYAARGATNDPDYLYSGSNTIGDVAWYSGNNSPNGCKPVGTKQPNALGIYDMSGNLWEWCWDRYGSYSSSEQTNPSGPQSGSSRLFRGGGWSNSSTFSRVASRGNYNPTNSSYRIGLRLARSAEDMVYIPAGSFTMGDTQGIGDSDEVPTHTVNLSAFYVGKHEVTQAEWISIMGSNPSDTDSNIGDNYPVNNFDWYSSIKYCNKVSISENLTPAYSVDGDSNPDNWGNTFEPDFILTANGYRLLTEAEWEYAARGATDEPDYLYSGSDIIGEVAWYELNSEGLLHEVGTKQPNSLGIYDMSGNIGEWCWDWYDSYTSDSQTNPTGPSTYPQNAPYRIVRGGYWFYNQSYCRVFGRSYYSRPYSSKHIGLRIGRSIN